jgi:cytosine/uracil/thiamine/allantoin permease
MQTHLYGLTGLFPALVTSGLIVVASIVLVRGVLSLYGKPMWMKSRYNDEMGRLGYMLIAVFVIVAGFVLLYLQFK